MRALVFNEPLRELSLQDLPDPVPGPGEALIKDLEIVKSYVPGYHQVLGHEFVGEVLACQSQPDLVGKRVVGDINCNVAGYTCADAIYQRNHAPGRTVLGIINKDGVMAERCTLPVTNLHVVPDVVTDQQACYVEPLAAACRILEQRAVAPDSKVAVIGDGKLGLLVAAVLVTSGTCQVTLLGRHQQKMELVAGAAARLVVTDNTKVELAGAFDAVVEASGSSQGIRLAMAVLRPMGTLILKSTVSLQDEHMPGWSELANDLVVNEKVLVGSRCGPSDVALKMLAEQPALRAMVDAMTSQVLPLSQGVEAMERAATKGVMKIQLLCSQ